jgi:hypothetical protein
VSTILKALRRLEAERSVEAPRDLREEVAAPAFASSPARSRAWAPAALVALALGGFGTWWMLPRETSGPPVASRTSAAARPAMVTVETDLALPPAFVPPPPAPVRDSQAPDLVEVGMPEQAFSSSVEVVKRPPAKPRIPLEEPAAPMARAPQRTEERQATGVESAARTAAAAPVAEPPVAAPPPKVAASAEPSVAVGVEKTRWHPKPQRREALVVLDGSAARTVREGDAVGPFRVTEIQPSGVLFERDGQQIRRGVGEDPS